MTTTTERLIEIENQVLRQKNDERLKLQNHLNIITNQGINLYLIKLKDLVYKLNNFGKKKKKKQMLKNFKKQD